MSDHSHVETGHNPNMDDEEMNKNTISLIVAFSESALKTASLYLLHGERNTVTPEDLKRSMMLEMFLFKHRDDALEKAHKIKKELFEELESKSDEEDDEDHEYDEDDEEFVENTCICSLCKCINSIYTRWDTFEPSTRFESIFQKHINNMC